ncbi:uncharacterized protein L969DRAFT_86466 [Mixia osmundae IAM 14324]|uniref:Bystin n=1 Tax=Mixia osmundae (strain CBS 9802 / IAM 14324 / JCM 22182 / KY 12970) TaxID=764103 RepID=G7E9C3_MIXOS|nr:uncharacterized protein L969DRAFT_86466 [Mixia osmundae IAM 14324]KEI39869.1 hypothetical protein L969DRAFT_86466 [Mixia osmundae IAM 14324]GAA99242.1 hypothetical protein E5Q_05936 [Mixia osmundae IAM 14324]
MGIKLKSKAGRDGKMMHTPLAHQIAEDKAGRPLKVKSERKQKKTGKGADDDQEGVPQKARADLTKRILHLAREQQDEELALQQGNLPEPAALPSRTPASRLAQAKDDALSEDEEEDELDFDEAEAEEEYEEMTDEQFRMMQEDMNHEAGDTLADKILAKIRQHEDRLAGKTAPKSVSGAAELNPKVVEVYSKVGQLLSRYKSGPLPKAFKILPTLPMWPTLLSLTRPQNWTPHATYAATRIFASNLDPRQSQNFFQEILLDKIREEIAMEKKLSVQLYMAIKKALYKPAAFFKGILFPLCESGNCTLREAAIVGSVLSKVSVPVLHSGAALLKLADMEYSGPNSLFIRVLLDKKYALPYKVVDAIVFHFIRFKHDSRQLPVLWHQSFLVFVQRYKQDLTEEQKTALLEVLRIQNHAQITPEIRREIASSVPRDAEVEMML